MKDRANKMKKYLVIYELKGREYMILPAFSTKRRAEEYARKLRTDPRVNTAWFEPIAGCHDEAGLE